ncbi:MAG: SDR family oxidoreductase [Pseudomonadota bacterium]
MTKTLLITGASTGIGEATARAAVANGWRVALAARSRDKLDQLASELGRDLARAITCDVQSPESVASAVNETVSQFGQVDAVFANAGLGATVAGTEMGEPDNWRDMILANCFGVALTAKYAIPELQKTKGQFLVTGSIAGRRNFGGSIYGATKWFVRGYIENLRDELNGTGVRVTEIAPGMVDTSFFDDPKPQALRPDDIARATMYALEQPASVTIGDIRVMPTPASE